MKILPMTAAKSGIIEFIPLWPENLSKRAAQKTEVGGNLRPETVIAADSGLVQYHPNGDGCARPKRVMITAG
jgi:hypothetical protein